ncbi:MAG TPA: hypothetical protein VEC37_08235, partial [Bacillota bacterium]|nr:hypothetical protein [Bacillota bacterium]
MGNHSKFTMLLIFSALFMLTVSPWPNGQAASSAHGKVWHVSSKLNYAYHQCYDVPAWNVNGSRILLRGKKGAVYLVKGLEAEPEPVKLPEVPV